MYSRETTTPLSIIFYYDNASLLAEINLRTSYRAKNIQNKEGEAQIDEFALTNDEKDAFDLFLKTAIYDAFSIVTKMTTGVAANQVFIDKTITISTVPTVGISGFSVLDNAAFNPNVLFSVDDGIAQYIKYAILAAWFELVGIDNEASLWEAKKRSIRADLINKRLFQLRKPLIS